MIAVQVVPYHDATSIGVVGGKGKKSHDAFCTSSVRVYCGVLNSKDEIKIIGCRNVGCSVYPLS